MLMRESSFIRLMVSGESTLGEGICCILLRAELSTLNIDTVYVASVGMILGSDLEIASTRSIFPHNLVPHNLVPHILS